MSVCLCSTPAFYALPTIRYIRAMRCSAVITCLLVLFPAVLYSQHTFLPEYERVVQRQRWFMQQRAFPADNIPAETMLKAVNTELAKRQKNGQESIQYTWESLGPDTIAGRISSLAVHPNNPNFWVGGSGGGGVWYSSNRGASWQRFSTRNFPVYAIGCVAYNPHAPNELYAGTGEPNFASFTFPGAGIMRSVNGGQTWSQHGTATLKGSIADLVFHPDDDSLMFAACAGFGDVPGVYRSTNRGATWQRVLEGTSAMDIAIHPTRHNIIYATLSYPLGNSLNGLYRSLDTGRTWTKLSTGLPAAHGRVALTVTPAAPDRLYALISTTDGQLNGLYISSDTGSTFTTSPFVPSNLLGYQGWYNITLAVSPTTVNDMVIGGVKLYRSTSAGSSWTEIELHPDQHALAYLTSDSVLVANDGGVYGVRNFSAYPKNHGLVTTQYYDIGIFDNAKIFGGTQDNGSHIRWQGNWAPTQLGGDVMRAIVHQTIGGMLFAAAPYGLIFKSTTDGLTWFSSTNGIDYSQPSAWKAPLYASEVLGQSSTLFTATTRVYRTTNLGVSWQEISTDLASVFDPITALAQARSDANVIVAAAQNGKVFYTRTGGTVWSDISAGLPERTPTSVNVHPTDRRTFLATFSGYGVPHIWKTIDQGSTWFNVSGNLPDVPINCFTFDPSLPATKWYIGTDFGVYYTLNGGQNWLPLTSGLGIAPVMDIEISVPTGELYIATFGMGVFRTQIAFLPVELVGFQAAEQGSDVLLTWETASELNNSHFFVERSTDGTEFEPIARVAGVGTSSVLQRYSFLDTTVPDIEMLFYRLAQTDMDGTVSYSKVVTLAHTSAVYLPGNPEGLGQVALAPNPFGATTTVQYRLRRTSKVTMVLYSLTGRELRRFFTDVHHNSGSFTLEWDGTDSKGVSVPVGMYMLRLTVNNLTTTIPVIKQ